MQFDNTNKPTGIRRVLLAFNNTLKGFWWMCKNEAAFKQEVALTLVLTLVTFLLDITLVEQAILISTLLGVLLIETINTAIEAVVDRIGLEIHPLSGLAKDLGSAAVFLSLTIAFIIWGAILWN
ncbi:MAG: diacylglycerol kinase [Psychrobium sp.]